MGKDDKALEVRGEFGVLPSDWQDRLAKYAQDDAAAATGGPGWSFIGTSGGVFSFNEEILDSPLEVIILGAVRENIHYEGAYDPSAPNSPTCFAVGKVGEGDSDLAPPDTVEKPQAETCDGCWANEFGSADTGRGKACKNTVRLALLSAGDLGALGDVEGARLRLPVTSIKNFAAYTNKITKGLQRPLFSVVTAVSIIPDPKTQFKVTFAPVTPINDGEVLTVLESRVKEATPMLEQIFQPAGDSDEDKKDEKDEKPARRKKAASKKAASKKAASKKAASKKAEKPTQRKRAKKNGDAAEKSEPKPRRAAGGKPRPRKF